MLDSSDGALIIGDGSLDASRIHPEKVVLDLGLEWQEITGNPMVFGVFATRKDHLMKMSRNSYLS